MSCGDVLECIGEEVLKEYKNLAHNRGLQRGHRRVHQVGAGSNGEAVMDQAGDKGGDGFDDDDDDEDKPAETAVCAFVANSVHKESNRGSWKRLQQVWKKREKKERCRVGDPPLSFREFFRAHPQGCFVCYGRSSPFQQDQRQHAGVQEGTRVQEAYVSQHPGSQSGGVQGRALKADDGRDQTCE